MHLELADLRPEPSALSRAADVWQSRIRVHYCIKTEFIGLLSSHALILELSLSKLPMYSTAVNPTVLRSESCNAMETCANCCVA